MASGVKDSKEREIQTMMNDDEVEETKFIESGKRLGLLGKELASYVSDRIKDVLDRKERAAQREQDRLDRLEKEKREHELELARIAASQNSSNGQGSKRPYECKLPHFDEKTDDMDAFINKFEKTAQMNKWPKDNWPRILISLMTGKANTVISAFTQAECEKYDTLKNKLLLSFQCSANDFRSKFKSCQPGKDEIFSSFFGKISRYFKRWLELSGVEKDDPEAIMDFMLRDQIYSSCHPDLVSYLKEQQPGNCT